MSKFEKQQSSGGSKPDYKEGNVSRSQEQKDEGLRTVSNSTAPDTRYDTIQQVGEVAKAAETKAPKTGFNKKTITEGGSSLKQNVASKVLLSEGDYAGVPGGGVSSASTYGLKSLSYSGDAGSILGSAANSPVVSSPSRSDGRFDKKLDATAKKIDFLASEQVLTEYQNPKPLGESADEPQGYYGTPKNTSVRSQKSAGGTPASLLVERSADELSKDILVFSHGQYVKDSNVNYNVEPTKISDFTNGVRTDTDLSGADVIKYGNYLNRALKITLKKDSDSTPAYVAAMTYVSDDLTADGESDATINAASTNYIIDMNADEIARQHIDAKAGQETSLTWSPLGRAVPQPTQTVGLLRRIEADLGAMVYTAYKFASKGFAYQLNKASKDGQRTVTPIREMLTGDIAANMSSADYSNGSEYYNGYDTAFDPALYRAGSAALLIALFDTVGKYSTKADVLLQPRGLRKAFQVADNNMNVFRLKKEFAAALNNQDVFSTIDRGYDPMMPVCITDKVGIISCLDYARFGNYTRASYSSPRVYSAARFKYAYANRSSNYVVTVGHPLLDGIADFIEQHANKLFKECRDKASDKEAIITIPLNYATTTLGLWEFLVLYAVPFMQRARINSLRDVLDFEVNFDYPFSLETIANLNPRNAVNYSLTGIDEPLVTRQMIPSTAIKWIMPEFFWGVGTAGSSNWLTVMPYYFNEMQFTPNDNPGADGATGYTQEYMSGVMSFPVIRNGVRLGYLDDMYSMSERDVRLCLDRLVRAPAYVDSEVTAQYNVYKYGQANEGIPCIAGRFTLKQLLSTPRELGWFMDAPYGLLRVKDNLKANATKFGYDAFAPLTDYVDGNTSYRLRCYKGVQNVKTEILQAADVNIDRSQAFKQYWDESIAAYCEPIGSSTTLKDFRARLDVGFLVSMRQCFNSVTPSSLSLAENQGSFIPFTVAYAVNSSSIQNQSTDDELKVVALHKGLWGRLQRLPMVISPFDTCDFASGSGANYDPYDFAYMFGLAGMMASDYNQDLYNRTNQVQDQGWLYVSDPFVAASPIFKDSIKYTMQVLNKILLTSKVLVH